ncbi:hypothetical protein RGQ29_026064 [Quercus rubra]|uniref:CCHC-type domain-containing protein n=1 Tax=Quercus rubra TaxID=3512 RepID=A0AAN7IQN5_QUERU|nr:hypothetical protein RGQ29_026064 [Quercus rubra]
MGYLGLTSETENFITLALPKEFIIPWQKQGYTHLHFGAVRLALTFHGRKGLPVVSRISLLDSRFLEYQNAVIGTVQTTLNASTIFVTLFLCKDPHLCDALKVQDTFAATLHYQLAYRLQNHAFDMAVPDIAQSNDALLIQVDPGMTPIKESGEVEAKFLMAPSEKKDVTVFPTQIVMLQPVSYASEDGLQIKAFREDGKPCYEGKSPSGHIWWDVCDCVDCQKEESFEEDWPKRKKKSSQQKLKERYEAGDPEVDLLGEPSGKFDYYNFPPLESFDHPQTNTKHVWKIKNPVRTNSDGTKKQVSSAEAALNWQAENAVVQNKVLSKFLDNQQKMAEAVNHTFSSSNTLIEDLKKKIKAVEKELETITSTVKDLSVSFPLIGQKEKEKKQLLPSGILLSIIWPVPSQPESQVKPQNDSPFMKKDKEPLYQLPDPTIGASSRPPDMNMLTVDLDLPNPISSFLKTLTLNDSRDPFVLPVIKDSDLDLSDLGLEEVFMTNNEPKVEEEDDVLRPENPPSPPPPIFPLPPLIPDYQTMLAYSPTTDSKHLFTLDNAPPFRWHDEIFKMYSWCIAKLQAPNATVSQIIAKFVARITGRLREWWINLGEYRQRQAAQSNTLEDFFTIVHNKFLGSATHYTEVAREEFLLMKCCSFERKDLEKHFDRMSRRYYSFNGMDDVNTKHTFLNSLLELLGDETLRMMNLQRITLQQASLGEIYQHVIIALEKLYNQRKFLSEIDKVHGKLKDNCRRKDLQIKCYEKNCACPQKKRYHFKKYFGKKGRYAGKKKTTFRKKKWKFLRRKQFKGKTSKTCFVCRRPGHFARNCPKKEKVAKLLEQAQIHAEDIPFSDIELLFSLDDEYSPQVLAVMAYSTSE